MANPSTIIATRFGGRFVFSDDGNEAFQQRAEKDANIRLVYQDRWSKIYRVFAK